MKVPPRPIGRRSLLIFGAATGLALAGCTDQGELPRPRPSTPAPTPTPDPLPGTVYAAEGEDDLASFADTMLITFADDLDAADRRLLTVIRDAHRHHAAVLSQPDPLALPGPTPSTAPSSSVSGSPSASHSASSSTSQQAPDRPSVGRSPDRAFTALAAMESDAADGYRYFADPPKGPQDQLQLLGLLWGSLAAAASMYAEACERRRDPGRSSAGDRRVAAELPSPVEAMQNVVAQCYPMVFGYQTAIPRLSGARGDHARATMAGYRDLRDLLSARLTGQDEQVPGPRAAYELAVPTDEDSASELIATLETRMLPYLGQWLATAEDRTAPLTALLDTAREVQIWNPMIMVWPGWPTEA